MQRYSLWFTTFGVLLLHWLVLEQTPWHVAAAAPAEPSGPVFQTRTIAPPAPPPPEPVAQPRPVVVRPRPMPAPVEQAKTSVQPETPTPAPVSAELAPSVDTATAHPPETNVASNTATTDNAASPTPPPAPSVASAEPAPAAPPALPTAPPAPEPGIELTTANSTTNAAQQKPLVARWPASKLLEFEVSGQAKRFNYHADATLSWQHDGQRYQAEQKISAFLMGQRTQRSVGTLQGDVLQPERFSDRSRSEKAAHFDAANQTVTFSSNAPSARVGSGTQDRLSVFIQLAAWLYAAPERFPVGSVITVTTVSTSKADRWSFRVEGEQTLDLPIGSTPTIKLERLPREQYDQKAELWLAPSLEYLPVRIRLTQTNGDFADLKLSHAKAP